MRHGTVIKSISYGDYKYKHTSTECDCLSLTVLYILFVEISSNMIRNPRK